MVDLQSVKARHPIGQVAARIVALRRSGQYLKGRCPFHPDRTPSFVVDAPRGRWRCFGRCATGWLDVIDFAGWQRRGSAWNPRNKEMFKQALQDLGAGTPVTFDPRRRMPALPPATRPPSPVITVDSRTLLDRVAAIYCARLWAMGAGPGTPLAYLRLRGFTSETIRRAGLGYCAGDEILKYLRQNGVPLALARSLYLVDPERGDREFLRGRIVIPDLGAAGGVRHLSGRKWAKFLGVGAPKYLALKGMDRPLYGWATLSQKAADMPVYVVESLPDRLTLTQWGLPAVATVGTALKESHARLLAGLPRPLLFVAQNDGGTGMRAVQHWRAAVGRGQILQLPDAAKDVNELALLPGGRQAFFALLQRRGLPPGVEAI